jgi:hypothetical protein
MQSKMNNLLQRIFSVKNEQQYGNIIQKVVTIFGIKLKFKVKNKA